MQTMPSELSRWYCAVLRATCLVWASWVPVSHPSDPLLDEILCHAGLGLTFGQGTFIYLARPCQYGRRDLGSALNERLFLYKGEPHT